ncbi:MAG: polyprenyl synthetase family protein, partial [Rubrivivax sp.]|nr:polyprenyl synthetase family protein [Rubrivivax sp.]
DDLLDYEGNSSELGKNVGDDLREGKPTLPLLLAMERASDSERGLIRQAIEHGEEEKLPQILAIVRQTGALDATRQAAQAEADKARTAILSHLPASRAREALLDLCARSIHRSS